MTQSFVQLGDIAEFINGFAFKPSDWHSSGMPIIRIQNLSKSGSEFNRTERPVPEKYFVQSGDLLVSWSATLGVFKWDGPNAFVNQHIFKVIPDRNKVDIQYLFYAIDSSIHEMERFTHGSTMKHINRGEFLSHKIPLPPLEEQRRIAAILDKADALRQKRKQAISLLDSLTQSIFLEIFGDLHNNTKGWNVETLESACDRITVGIVVKPASYYQEQGVPALRSLNIGINSLKLDDLVYVSASDNDGALRKSKLVEGDVVIVRTGQPGKAAIVPKDLDGANAIDLLIVTPNTSKIAPQFLCTLMNSGIGKRIVLSEKRGQIQQHLNVGSLKSAQVPIPPISEQKRFVSVLKRLHHNTSLMQKAFAEQHKAFTSLQHRAFAGEL